MSKNKSDKDMKISELEKYKYMVSWRNKKISLLEEEIKSLENELSVCCKVLAAVLMKNKNTWLTKEEINLHRLSDFCIDEKDGCYVFEYMGGEYGKEE